VLLGDSFDILTIGYNRSHSDSPHSQVRNARFLTLFLSDLLLGHTKLIFPGVCVGVVPGFPSCTGEESLICHLVKLCLDYWSPSLCMCGVLGIEKVP